MLAYFFPPIGGGGVQRTVKFARYLPDFGYEPVILTGNGGAAAEHLGSDDSLRGELPAKTEVHRVAAPEPPPSTLWRARLERWLRVRPEWRRWWIDGTVAAARGAADVDLVFATMSPFDSAEAAAAIAAERRVPWVADLRDPWALDEMLVWPTAVQRLAERRRMRKALAGADAIVMNTPEAAEAVAAFFPELRARTTVITNGFDASDFEPPVARPADGRFRIVHAGFLHTAAGRSRSSRLHHVLGGANVDVEYLTRSHVFLLRAVERVLAVRPELEGVIEVHLVGPQSAADRAETARFVRAHGYLPHEESVRALRTADLLFLPMHNVPSGYRTRIVPGKTYEYLAAGPTILAAAPAGDARDLLERSGNAVVTGPDDVDAMARAILDQIDRNGAGPPPVDREFLAAYERRELTRRLAAVFDGLSA